MAYYKERHISKKILEHVEEYPVVALLGPRQVGKSTLAKRLMKHKLEGIYLDLERKSQINKLTDPEAFLNHNKTSFICFDEIQRLPEIFPLLRSVVDERATNKNFLVLGSASRDLLKQSSESLAGRISYLEMTPFTLSEISERHAINLWLRGGFPRSFLSKNQELSSKWRENFIRTFLERDIPQLGFHIPSHNLGRLWQMLAHDHGQVLNSSRLASSLGVTAHTINNYIQILTQTFLVRTLQPFRSNLKKRLVKAPKVYIRDSGLLHSLLGIDSMNELLGHPIYGTSFEGFVIENIMTQFPRWSFYFYQTRSGAEIDLVMTKGRKIIAIEIKASTSPKLEKGFFTAAKDVEVTQKYLIAPVDTPYPVKDVMVTNLSSFLRLDL